MYTVIKKKLMLPPHANPSKDSTKFIDKDFDYLLILVYFKGKKMILIYIWKKFELKINIMRPTRHL